MKGLSTIKNQLTSQGLFEAFRKQLAKDFEQSNFSTDFISSLEPDYKAIHRRLVFELEDSQKKADTNAMQLLYRIDISEAQLKRYLYENKNQDPLHVMAELIIKRVLQKVVIRKLYKNNEQG